MKHILIAIGCDSYDHVSPLYGAENDARKMFSMLTDDKYGFCDPTSSTLILSPSLAELQEKLRYTTSSLQPGDLLTFYFAGHGHVKGNIFYMCCRDTTIDRIGVSAWPLNNLLSLIHEIAPRHANLIVDACNSGGVMGDFNRALSPDTIGSAATTGITLLAACAQDQFAAEINGNGLCTTIVARCINGTTFVQDLDSALDLTSISAVVSDTLRDTEQQPTCWGLNLTGRPNFCINPHFAGDNELRRTLAEAKPMAMPPGTAKAFQSLYGELDHRWSPTNLQRLLVDALSAGGDPSSHLGFVHNLLGALRHKAAQSRDPFREIEVATTCLSPLLEYCKEHPVIEQYVVEQCAELGKSVVGKSEELHDALLRDEFALLGDTGMGELFVLPQRITSLFGWLAWAILVSRKAGGNAAAAEQLAERLLITILHIYSGSIRAMTDAQAPALLVIGAVIQTTQARDSLEELIGLYFADLCHAGGVVSREDLEPSHIVDFLLAKSSDGPNALETIANPSTFVCVLLALAKALDLGEAFDSGMGDLDHRNANAFIPTTYSHFSRERIEQGYNATFRIGHGIWRIEDFSEKWEQMERPTTETVGVCLLSTACSLIYPDRVAWHLVA